jgi:glycosyltransferase involved in cell wall biosynthesis
LLKTKKKKIFIVTPTFNEEGNIKKIIKEIRNVMKKVDIDYQHLIIDNASTDQTVKIVDKEIDNDKRLSLIVNNRDFGHMRSPFYGLMQSNADASIVISADLEDPPSLIPQMVQEWKKGAKLVCAIANDTEKSFLYNLLRITYYKLIDFFASYKVIKNFSGYALYDKCIVDDLKKVNLGVPYIRGLLPELGYSWVELPFKQGKRKIGVSKHNILTLIDLAFIGFFFHIKKPLRILMILSILGNLLCMFVAIIYVFKKLLDWDFISISNELTVIGIFFVAFTQLFALGVLSEYLGTINSNVEKMPLVVEKFRKNI